MIDLDDESKWVLASKHSEAYKHWKDENGETRKSLTKSTPLETYAGYYKNGEYHRLVGPARIWSNKYDGIYRQQWFFEGEMINVSSQQEFERFLKMKAFW